MTIDEAIAHAREVARVNRLRTKHPAVHRNDEDEIEACLLCAEEHEQLAEWLEELKEYQQYGTPDGYESALKAYDDCYFEKEEISNELQKYKQLGTLEEVRKAVERQQAKKVTNTSKGDKLRFGICACCGRRISNVEGGNYCQNCGQRLE